jgi:hypothetical protein
MNMIINNPNLAGQQAGKAEFYNLSRFKLYPIHTRFNAIQWFIADAEIEDDIGHPAIVGQYDDKTEAIASIPDAEK